MLSRRNLFSVLAAAASAVVSFKPSDLFAKASEPKTLHGVMSHMASLKAKREAEPAVHWANTAFRGVNGLSKEMFPPIYGDGIRDDAPGFTAILGCKERQHTVNLTPYLVYRLHSPLPNGGHVRFTDPGTRDTWIYLNGELSGPLATGHVRLFWFEDVDGYGIDAIKVADVRPA